MLNEQELSQKFNDMSHEELVRYAVQLQMANQNFKEQLQLIRARKFGHTSEKLAELQLNLFNEAEDTLDHAQEEDLQEVAVSPRKKGKKSKSKEADYSSLPTQTVHYQLEEKKCPECGAALKELKPNVYHELVYVPSTYKIIKHVVHHYVCEACTEADQEMKEIEANHGNFHRLIEGSVISASVVAGIATNKFVSDVPLYRQEQELKRRGIPISRQNMSNWLIRCGEDLLEPIFNAMWEDARELTYRHMDETPLVVIEDKKEGREKSYEWLLMSGRSEEKQMALYFYDQTRGHDVVEKILGKGSGNYVHSDGYQAYRRKGFTNVACMAHVRRKFIEALEVSPAYKEWKKSDATRRNEVIEANPSLKEALQIVSMINELFELDKEREERKRMKEEKAAPLYDDLFTCLKKAEGRYMSGGKMGKAIKYAIGLEQELRNYLLEEELEISNNRAERAIKPFVMARKNFLFSNTKRGAKQSSIYFSMIETAKMNDLDPYKYLRYVLERMSKEKQEDQLIQELLPYSKKLPRELYKRKRGQ